MNSVPYSSGDEPLSLCVLHVDDSAADRHRRRRGAADASRLQQVFVNVLSNAARYTPAGGEIRIALGATPSGATVHVKDTGAGIPPADLHRIFDLFVRANDEAGGLGIGLAVARTIVEKHGGTIDARSAGVGRGSEFVITLPTASAAA